MYIMPDTEVRLIRDCPLLPTYEHTIWFDDLQEQYDYFSSLKNIKFEKVSYQRHTKNTIKLTILADKIYDCNYMMFRNKAFGNKWFYAFINKIEYVSNTTSLIEYQIDVMQTWLFDYDMKQCFVAREHTMNDTIGSNLIPEKLEIGEYVVTKTKNYYTTHDETGTPEYEPNAPYLTIWTTEKGNSESVKPVTTPTVVNGVPVNFYVYAIEMVDEFFNTQLQTIIDSFAEKKDSIYAMCVMPSLFFEVDNSGVHIKRAGFKIPYYDESSVFKCAKRTLTKTPRNNKLYTHPYCNLVVQAGATANNYKYEFFEGSPEFEIRGYFSIDCLINAIPKKYKGHNYDYTTSITLTDFPKLAWVSDFYSTWFAQNKTSLATNLGGDILSSVANLFLGSAVDTVNPVLGITSAISGIQGIYNGITNYMSAVEHHKAIPDTVGGTMNIANGEGFTSNYTVKSYCQSITPEYIDMIDDYFDKFGYSTNLIKIPNRSGRKSWNFVKTVGCNITGGIPADDTKTICSIYDNGITFWKNGKTIGDYTQDNSL